MSDDKGARLPYQRSIDALICSATWEIDPVWAQGELNRYLADLEAISAGVPYSELGYSERRAGGLPSLIPVSAAQFGGKKTSSSAEIPTRKIAVLSLEGVMRSRDGLSSYGINSLASQLRNVDAMEEVGGVILKVNSGGGESIAGRMLQGAIRDMSKPVLVLAEFMASAAVRGTLDAPYIWATGNGAEVGSIGTMVSINREISEYYRANVEEIYAEQATDKNREWRDYLAGNRMPLIEELTSHNEVFIEEAKEKRGIAAEALTGKMFTARKAMEVGLIDKIGTFQEAVNFLSGVILEEERTAQNDNGRSFYSRKNNEQMNFDQFFKPFSTAWARITGREESEAEGMTPEAVLEEAQALDVVSREEHEAALAVAQARIAELEGEVSQKGARVTELEKSVAQLKAAGAVKDLPARQSGLPDLEPKADVMAGFVLEPQAQSKY